MVINRLGEQRNFETFNVPNEMGTLWPVFTLEINDDEEVSVTPGGEMGYVSDPRIIGSLSSDPSKADDSAALDLEMVKKTLLDQK